MPPPFTTFPIPTIDFSAAQVAGGGGSSLRTLIQHFGDVVNVKDFGAIGDGVHDDTTNIQAAIDYAFTSLNSVIWMPNGQYVTSAPLWLDHPNNMRRVDLGNPSSPALGVTPPGFASPPIWQFSAALVGQWAGGPNENASNMGVQIFPTYNSGAALYMGPGQGMAAVGFTIYLHFTGPFRGGLPAGGLGVGMCSSGAGPTRTMLDRVGVIGAHSSFMTGANGNGSLGDDNWFQRCFTDNTYIAFNISQSQNFMNHFIDCEPAGSTIGLYAPTGTGATVFGGNWSQNSLYADYFGLSSISAVTAVALFGGNYQAYQFTATVAATGGGGNPRSLILVNLTAFAIKTAHFGIVPLTCTAFNPGTGVGTFQTPLGWSIQMAGIGGNFLTSSNFGTEVQAATTLYAVEMATTWLGNGITVRGNVHIENSGPTCLFYATQNFGTSRENVISEVTWNTDASQYSGAADPSAGAANFYVAQTWPTIQTDTTSTSTTIRDCSFLMNQGDTICVDAITPNGSIHFQNNAYLTTMNFRCQAGGGASTGTAQTGAGIFWDQTAQQQPFPFVNNGGPSNRQIGSISSGPSVGYKPAPWVRPGINSLDFYNLSSGSLPAITAGPNVPYPLLCGGTIYQMWDNTFYPMTGSPFNAVQREFFSTHQGYSYGQNLTTTNVPGLTWSYQGGSYCVYMSQAILQFMFPGLCIILNNGVSGNQRYTVTGVYYHLGYVTVYVTSGRNGTLAGVVGTNYSGTTIIQDPYAIQLIGPQPAPKTITAATYVVLDSDGSLVFNASGTCTLTLPAAANYIGRIIPLRTIAAQTVVSASSNVVPIAGGAAGTAILAATAGKFANLQSDGTNWQIIASN